MNETIWIIDGPSLGYYAPFTYYDKSKAMRKAEDLQLGDWEFTLKEYTFLRTLVDYSFGITCLETRT